MFESVLSNAGDNLTILSAFECTGASLLLGLVIAACYYFTGRGIKNFCAALLLFFRFWLNRHKIEHQHSCANK